VSDARGALADAMLTTDGTIKDQFLREAGLLPSLSKQAID